MSDINHMVVIDGLNQESEYRKKFEKDLTFKNCVLYYIRHKIQRNSKTKNFRKNQ